MPKMRRIVPVRVSAVTGHIFCYSGKGSKLHVTLDYGNMPMCNTRAINIDNLVYTTVTKVEVTDVCKRCLKHTEEVK